MTEMDITSLTIWEELVESGKRIQQPENHLRHIVSDEGRLKAFSRTGGGLFYDFSRQRIDQTVFTQLIELAKKTGAKKRFNEMVSGAAVNVTENRPALHTAARDPSATGIILDDGTDVSAEIHRVLSEIEKFSNDVHEGKITGTTRKRFSHVIVTGIGGSYLGTQFAATALSGYADKNIELYFLSNVDADNFCEIEDKIDPETTMWIVVSKSYTTVETLANEALIRNHLKKYSLDPADHIVTVTSKGSPGDDKSNPVCAVFHMFDFIGGRFSVTSAVGGLPLSLYLGFDRFRRFLNGAHEMDIHAKNAEEQCNIPLIAALLEIWNTSILGYPAQAIIPYSHKLRKLPAHIQQLAMESNGKSVTIFGTPVKTSTCSVIFGEPGTNAQHSFFQLLHQGQALPIEFIGVIHPACDRELVSHNGVTNHQELWANMIAQAKALAEGKKETNDPARRFDGNRPCSTLILPDLTPESIGRLLAFYEAKTVFAAFIWGINPFDQFGVELGKKLAGNIRTQLTRINKDPLYEPTLDPIEKKYIEMLIRGSF